jgi:hypothetical protein
MFTLFLLFFKLQLFPLSATPKRIFLLIALQKKEIETLRRSLGFQRRRIRFSSRLKRVVARVESTGRRTRPPSPVSDFFFR